MPGITGIIRSPNFARGQLEELDTMVDSLLHEAFYLKGSLEVEPVALEVGWTSLPGIGLGCQTVWNERRDVGLIFFGDEFASRNISDGLRARALSVVDGLECLIRLYEESGLRFLEALNGCFCGVLIDLRDKKVILFNDRYGLNRIYYHESPNGFYFSSEAKSLLAVRPHLREIDQRSLAEFFSVGCVLQNRALFKDIALVPGGSVWIFDGSGKIDRQRYFEPSTWEDQESLGAGYGEQLIEVFGRVIKKYLTASEPVAMSLTGGLDSRIILAWARANPGSLPCYTFGGPYRECADVSIARRLARLCQQPHTTIPVGNDFFADFDTLAEKTVYISDGTMDVSGAVELYVNRIARTIAPIRLTGNYGSEILRSNLAFRPARLDQSSFTPEFCQLLRQAEETYRIEASGRRLSTIAFKQVPWHHYARRSIEQSQLTPRSPYLDNELVALAYRAPPELATSALPLLELIDAGNPALDVIGTDRALRRQTIPLISKFAQAWREFTAKAEYAYDYGMPLRLTKADHVFSRLHLERLFLGRHKFYHFRIWYKYQLSQYLLQHFAASDPLPSCFKKGTARKLVSEHLSGRSNQTLPLHKMITLQLIERTLILKR